MTDRLDTIRRAICREKCAYRGEPPCFSEIFHHGDPHQPAEWPNPHCDEPGCDAEAAAVEAALSLEEMKR